VLLSLAQQQPENARELSHIRSLERKTRDRFGDDILKIINTAKQTKPEPLPPFVKKEKLNAKKLATLQLLSAWVHQQANELNIAPSLLAPQKLLEKMVTGEGRAALKGWRDPLIGEDLDHLLRGQYALATSKKGLELIELDE